MIRKNNIEQIIRQERALVFDSFDESQAFKLGSIIYNMAVDEKLKLAIEISFWDRRLFFAATAGATSDNQEWARRKFNVVRRLHAASYRMVLEQNRDDRMFPPNRAMDVADYALAGGGFPIRVKTVGVVGAVVVSGLPQRDDHNLVVRSLALYLGQDLSQLELASE